MRVLIAGAAGFVGSHTVLELLEAGYDVYAIDNFYNSVEGEDNSLVVVATCMLLLHSLNHVEIASTHPAA